MIGLFGVLVCLALLPYLILESLPWMFWSLQLMVGGGNGNLGSSRSACSLILIVNEYIDMIPMLMTHIIDKRIVSNACESSNNYCEPPRELLFIKGSCLGFPVSSSLFNSFLLFFLFSCRLALGMQIFCLLFIFYRVYIVWAMVPVVLCFLQTVFVTV